MSGPVKSGRLAAVLMLAAVALPQAVSAKDDRPQLKKITVVDQSTSSKYSVIGTAAGDFFQTNTPLTILSQSGDTVISGVYSGNDNYAYIDGRLFLSDTEGNRACATGKFRLNTGLSGGKLSTRNKKWESMDFTPKDNGEVRVTEIIYRDKGTEYICYGDTLEIDFDNEGTYDMKGIISVGTLFKMSPFKATRGLGLGAYSSFSAKDRTDKSDFYLKTPGNSWYVISLPDVLHDVSILYNNGVIVDCSELTCEWGGRGRKSAFSTDKGILTVQWPESLPDVKEAWVKVVFGRSESDSGLFSLASEEGWLDKCPTVVSVKEKANKFSDSSVKWYCTKTDGKTYSLDGTKWLLFSDLPYNRYESLLSFIDRSKSERIDWYTVYDRIAQAKGDYANELSEREENTKRLEEKKAQARKQKYEELKARYGDKYASAIMDNKVIVGMSRQMVEEFVSPKMYNVTESVSGRIWVFSDEKAELFIVADAAKSEAALTNLVVADHLASAFMGKNYVDAARMLYPKKIVFADDKVVSVTY